MEYLFLASRAEHCAESINKGGIMNIFSVAPIAGLITTVVRDPRFEISGRIMREMVRAERKPPPQKRKFLKTFPPSNVQRGQPLVRDCIWLPARQLVWYAVTMVDDQSAGEGLFSKDPIFLPSNEFMLEVFVVHGKWTMRDCGFGILPMSSGLLVPLRE